MSIGPIPQRGHDLSAHAIHLRAFGLVAGRSREPVKEHDPGGTQPKRDQRHGHATDIPHPRSPMQGLTVGAAAKTQAPVTDAASRLHPLALLAFQLPSLPIRELLLRISRCGLAGLGEDRGQEQTKAKDQGQNQSLCHPSTSIAPPSICKQPRPLSADLELAAFEEPWDFTMTPDHRHHNDTSRTPLKLGELKKPTNRKRSAKGAHCTRPAALPRTDRAIAS